MINLELKKDMYVRYTRGAINGYVPPRIAKIINKNNDLLKLDNNNEILESDIIGKPSFDLINLIEVGDYVNGEKVTSAEPVDEKDTERYLGFGDYDYYIHTSEDIKSVVTKEQFNACKYVVERDTNENI